MKFRKKPIVIEAIQYTGCGNSWEECDEFVSDDSLYINEDGNVYIPTLEGDMKVSVGDWIIKGVNGEFYPCKPDIFAKSYESDVHKEYADYIHEIQSTLDSVEQSNLIQMNKDGLYQWVNDYIKYVKLKRKEKK